MPDLQTDFLFAFGGPVCSGVLRQTNEDFKVVEDLGFNPEGEGEHVYLDITKDGQNTAWIAKQLAKYAGVSPRDVGYCGLKDRHAITRQWFSVYLPKTEEMDWQAFNSDGVAGNLVINQVARGLRKLRRGQHQANQFEIVLRDLQSESNELLDHRLSQAAEVGVPNYFGEQRFGLEANNLHEAKRWFDSGRLMQKKQHRQLVVSAARSYLFNRVLQDRVAKDVWQVLIDGDIEMNGGPSGPMWGRGRPTVSGVAGEIEQAVLEQFASWCNGLEHVGLKQERRPLVMKPIGLEWELEANYLKLKFSLPPGQYATVFIREICSYR